MVDFNISKKFTIPFLHQISQENWFESEKIISNLKNYG